MTDPFVLKAMIVAEGIQALGGVPSGELYARLMGHFTLDEYERVISLLIQAKMVEKKNHFLTWIGPPAKES